MAVRVLAPPDARERNRRYNIKNLELHEAVFNTLTGSSALAVKVNAPLYDAKGKVIGCTCTDPECRPGGTNEKNIGKHPIGEGWNRQGTRDWDIAERWLREGYNLGYYPPTNEEMAKTPKVAPIIGIDLDEPTVMAMLFPNGIPDTVADTVADSGKWHLWFSLDPGADPLTLPAVFDGGEVARAGSRMLVAPLALHPDGQRRCSVTYQVLRLPQSVLEALQSSHRAQQRDWAQAKPGEDGWKVKPNFRHGFLTSRAGALRNAGMRDAGLLEALRWFNEERTTEGGKPDKEVERIASDYSKREGNDEEPIYLDVPRADGETKPGSLIFPTLRELPSGPPPPPLIDKEFIASEGVTVLYARGETGKGLLSLWMALWFLLNNDGNVVVIDYEGHRYEWGRRARGMGFDDALLDRVIYIDPYDPASPLPKAGPLPDIASDIREWAYQRDIGLYLLDSYQTAADSDAAMGGQGPAVAFFKAAALLPAPMLVLAHTTDTAGRFPAKPFGSSYIHNLARETWAGERTKTEKLASPPGAIAHHPVGVIGIELRNKKRSGGLRSDAQSFDITFWSDDRIEVVRGQPIEPTVSDLIFDVLADGNPYNAKEIAAHIKSETGKVVDENTVYNTANRDSNIVKEGGRRPYTFRWGGVSEVTDDAPGDPTK